MSERIRDLQIQAFAECKTFDDGKIRTDEVFERFAELIVKQCIRLCDQVDIVGADECIDNIKEHFEVK